MIDFIRDVPYKVEKSSIEGESEKGLYNAVVEIQNGDNVKYEIHRSGHYLTPVRTLNPVFRYPFSYGFIPQTLGGDGDCLDVIVVTAEPIARLSIVEVRIVGMIPTVDNGKEDIKIIAVPAYSHLKSIPMEKIMAFLRMYKYPNQENTVIGKYENDLEKVHMTIEESHERLLGLEKSKEGATAPKETLEKRADIRPEIEQGSLVEEKKEDAHREEPVEAPLHEKENEETVDEKPKDIEGLDLTEIGQEQVSSSIKEEVLSVSEDSAEKQEDSTKRNDWGWLS